MKSQNNIIGKKISELRKNRGWTQKQLAEKIGVTQSYIGNIENGTRNLSNIETVNKLLEVFNISFDYLFEEFILSLKSNKKSKIYKKFELELSQMDINNLELIHNIVIEFVKYKEKKTIKEENNK